MTTPLAATAAERRRAGRVIEKRPLERYLAPAKPSLVGLSRDVLADALGTIGVPERQRRMRVQQIWHWLYVRGAQDFDEMTTLSKELRAALAQRFTLARPEIAAEQISVDGTRKWLLRLPGEVDGRAARSRVRLHSGSRPRHAVHFEPGRLHAQLHVLPYRHAAAGAQSDAGRNRRPGRAGARPARRLAARRAPPAGSRDEAPRLQHRDDGHGRAALQFRGCARRPHRRGRRRGPEHLQAAHHAVDLGRGADDRARRRGDRRRCSRSRCMP